MQPNILYFDIETSLRPCYLFAPGTQYVAPGAFTEERQIISIAWAWNDEKEVHTQDWGKGKTYTKRLPAERKMLKTFSECMEYADIVVGHNINKFDLPIIRARLMAHGLPDLPPVITEDTYALSRKLGFQSKKLDVLGEILGVGRKTPTALSWWTKLSISNDQAVLKDMVKYNKVDVQLTRDVYKKMLPYLKPQLHRGIMLHGTSDHTCPECGSDNVRESASNQYYISGASKKVRLNCNDCGRKFVNPRAVKKSNGRYVN